MAIKDTVIELVLRAKNLISGEAAAAAASVDNVADSAEGLQAKLRGLEDQAKLIKEFERTSSAVDRTSEAYDKAQLRLGKLADKLLETGPPTARQAQEFEIAQKAVEKTSEAYDKAQLALSVLAQETRDAGIDVTDLSGAQRDNAKQITETKRAQQDYSEAVDDSSSRLGRFGEQLASGIARFAAWGTAAAAAGAALAFAAITRYTQETAALADQLLDTSDQLGVSTTRLQELGAASRTVGVDQNQLNSILKDMTKNIGAAADDSGRFVKVLESIGVEVSDIINLAPDEQLLKIADAISKLSTEQQVNVLERMGSGASKLLPLLQNNAVELERIVKAANDRGAIMSEEELQRLAQVEDAMDRITERLEGLRNKLVLAVAPAFEDIARIVDEAFDAQSAKDFQAVVSEVTTKLVGSVRDFVSNFGQFKESTQSVIDTLQFLGNIGVGVFKLLQAGLTTTLTIVSGVATAVSSVVETMLEGMNKLGLVSDETLTKARERTQNLMATTKDLGAQVVEYGKQALQAGEDALDAFDNAESGAQKAAAATKGLIEANEGVAESTAKTAASQEQLGKAIAETVAQIAAATKAWEEDPSEANVEKIEALRAKFAELQDQLASLSAGVKTSDGLGLSEEFRDAAEKVDSVAAAADKAKGKIAELGDKSGGVADDVRRVGDEAAQTGNQAGATISGIFSGWADHIATLSSAAVVAFRRALGFKDAAIEAGTLEQRLEAIGEKLGTLGSRISTNGITDTLLNWARAGLQTERSFLAQALAVQKLTERVSSGDAAVGTLAYTAEDLARKFDLLDGSQLSPLIGAIQSAKREMDALNESLIDTINASKQELAALRGDTEAVEKLRYQERQAELQEQLNRARALGDRDTLANAEEALRLADEAHDLRLRQAKEAAAAERQRKIEQETNLAQQRQAAEQEERQDITRAARDSAVPRVQSGAGAASAALSTLPVQTIRLQFSDPTGRSLGDLNVIDDAGIERFLEALERSGYLTTRH